MKIRLIDPQNSLVESLKDFSCPFDEVEIVRGDGPSSEDTTLEGDVVVAAGVSAGSRDVVDALLAHRLNSNTYLTPCFVVADREAVDSACIWPHLAIDRFAPSGTDADEIGKWLGEVAEWQQNRMNFAKSNSLSVHSPLE
ncbi:MAG: hypothetical protein ACLGPL_06435, partial [Acidobacteriota bacterium]